MSDSASNLAEGFSSGSLLPYMTLRFSSFSLTFPRHFQIPQPRNPARSAIIMHKITIQVTFFLGAGAGGVGIIGLKGFVPCGSTLFPMYAAEVKGKLCY